MKLTKNLVFLFLTLFSLPEVTVCGGSPGMVPESAVEGKDPYQFRETYSRIFFPEWCPGILHGLNNAVYGLRLM